MWKPSYLKFYFDKFTPILFSEIDKFYKNSKKTAEKMKGISALYILDKKGKILVTRHYRNDVPHYINDK